MDINIQKLPRKSWMNAPVIMDIARELGWKIMKVDYNTGMIRYQRNKTFINVYTTSCTITTEMNHPKKGKTQLHRKYNRYRPKDLSEIFFNPRKHTAKGYYKK